MHGAALAHPWRTRTRRLPLWLRRDVGGVRIQSPSRNPRHPSCWLLVAVSPEVQVEQGSRAWNRTARRRTYSGSLTSLTNSPNLISLIHPTSLTNPSSFTSTTSTTSPISRISPIKRPSSSGAKYASQGQGQGRLGLQYLGRLLPARLLWQRIELTPGRACSAAWTTPLESSSRLQTGWVYRLLAL